MITGLTVKTRCNQAFYVTFYPAFLVKPSYLSQSFPAKMISGLIVKARFNRAFHVTFNRALSVKPGKFNRERFLPGACQRVNSMSIDIK